MSRQYEGSLQETLNKIYLPFLKFLSVISLFVLAFVSVNIFSNVTSLTDGYVFQEYIVRENNLSLGPTDSRVTLVYIFDLQCPVCSGYDSTMSQIKDQYKDKVFIVYKNSPLQDLHPQAPQAHRAVQAATMQDKTKAFAYVSTIYANQKEGLTNENLRVWAQESGLDVDKWQQDRISPTVKQDVAWDLEDIKQSIFPESANGRGTKKVGDLAGTPSLLIYKDKKIITYLSGSEPLDSLKQYLDDALAN